MRNFAQLIGVSLAVSTVHTEQARDPAIVRPHRVQPRYLTYQMLSAESAASLSFECKIFVAFCAPTGIGGLKVGVDSSQVESPAAIMRECGWRCANVVYNACVKVRQFTSGVELHSIFLVIR